CHTQGRETGFEVVRIRLCPDRNRREKREREGETDRSTQPKVFEDHGARVYRRTGWAVGGIHRPDFLRPTGSCRFTLRSPSQSLEHTWSGRTGPRTWLGRRRPASRAARRGQGWYTACFPVADCVTTRKQGDVLYGRHGNSARRVLGRTSR